MRFLATLCLAVPSVALADTYTVNPDGSGDFTDINDALAIAVDGDEIVLSAGEHGAIVVDGARAITIKAELTPGGASATVPSIHVFGPDARLYASDLNISGSSHAVEVTEGILELERVGIRDGGNEADGFAVAARTGAQVTLTDVVISRFTGDRGVVYAEGGSTLTMQSSRIEECNAGEGGAMYFENATVTLSDVTLADNRSSSYGGAIALVDTVLTASDLLVAFNTADSGGAVYVGPQSVATFTDSDFSGNMATDGGHIYLDEGILDLRRVRLTGGLAMRGGAISMQGGTLWARNFQWSGQERGDEGGALFMGSGTADLRFGVIYGNPAEIGGGVAMEGGTLLAQGLIMVGNGAEAIAAAGDSEATISQSILWKNEDNNGLLGNVTIGDGVLPVNPRFLDPELSQFVLTTHSPAIDAGVAGAFDPDGTPADMGMFGGEEAWALGDEDGDGFVYGRDCDDEDDTVNEIGVDEWYDGVDSNCDGQSDFDEDRDGFDAVEFGGHDCMDTDPRINPATKEQGGDAYDSDCDGLNDPDRDHDGWAVGLDCDDMDASVRPDAEEVYYDGIDANCDGRNDFDQDRDGFTSADFHGADCNDLDPSIRPDVLETVGDGVDNNCDGSEKAVHVASEGQSAGEALDDPPVDPFANDSPESWMTRTTCSTVPGATGAGWLVVLLGLALGARRRRD